MKIAVDAMGGDNAPEDIVRGAMAFVEQHKNEVILIGDENKIAQIARTSPHWEKRLHVCHAPAVASATLSPTEVIRKQKDSSIVVAARLVKEGEANALVSAGNTGVTMVAALMTLGRIRGIDRPAIATAIPTKAGPCVVLDVGANADSRPNHLAQFAVMGSVYAERVLGVSSPKIALLSNGEEDEKGNEVVIAAHQRIKDNNHINFVGNIESRDIFDGNIDVLVCDGFVGNVVLKLAEGMAKTLFDMLKDSVQQSTRTRIGGALLRPALRDVWHSMDYTEYGGALLLGISGVCVIAHGSSNAKAIHNAIRVATESVHGEVPEMIAKLNEQRAVKSS